MTAPGDEMQVRNWGKAATTVTPRPAPQVSLPEPSPDTPHPAPAPAPAFQVDVLRLAGAVLCKWRWILLAGVIGLFVGGMGVYLKARTNYKVTVKLIRKTATTSFRAGRLGEAYSPPPLKGATLIAAAASYPVLQKVASKAQPPISVEQLKGAVEVLEEKKTDLIDLNLTGYVGKEATARLANLWATEAVEYTCEMQAKESREIRVYLEQQVEAGDAEIAALDQKILEATRKQGSVNAQLETDAYLRSLTGVELQFHHARIALETIDAKIEALRQALRRQSPATERLREMQQRLEGLRAQYTEENPIVIEAQQKFKALQDETEKQRNSREIPESAFTGTGIGNSLYLELVQLENQKKSLSHEKEELSKLMDENRERLRSIPEKAMNYQRFVERKQSLLGAQELLSSRLQEARLFEGKAPGYLQIVSPVSAAEVSASSRAFKTGLAGVALMLLAMGVTVGTVAGREFLDSTLRTRREATMAMGGPPTWILPARADDGDEAHHISEIWSRWIGAGFGASQTRVVWCPSPGALEERFWLLMLKEARRLMPRLVVIDCGGIPLKGLAELPMMEGDVIPGDGIFLAVSSPSKSLLQAAGSIAERASRIARGGNEVWLRVCGPVQEPGATVARLLGDALLLVVADAEPRTFWQQQRGLIESNSIPLKGYVFLGDRPTFSFR
jgi:capsular polysaccharide biosynthesis protein